MAAKYVGYNTRVRRCAFEIDLDFCGTPSNLSVSDSHVSVRLQEIVEHAQKDAKNFQKEIFPPGSNMIHLDDFIKKFNFETTPIVINEVSIRKIYKNTFDEGVGISIFSKEPELHTVDLSEIPLVENMDKTMYIVNPKHMSHSLFSIMGSLQCEDLKDLFVGLKCHVVTILEDGTHEVGEDEQMFEQIVLTDYMEEHKKTAPFLSDILNHTNTQNFDRLLQIDKKQNHALINALTTYMCFAKQDTLFKLNLTEETNGNWWSPQIPCKYVTESERHIIIPECMLIRAAHYFWLKYNECREYNTRLQLKDFDFFYFNPRKRTEATRSSWKGLLNNPDLSTESKECNLRLYIAFYVDMIHSKDYSETENLKYYPTRYGVL